MANQAGLDSYISVKARSVDVDDVYGIAVAGVHSKVITSLSERKTEADATQAPIVLRLLPIHATMLELEFEGMQPRLDKNGRQLKIGLRNMALWIWIAARMKPFYPDITFLKVRDELDRPFMVVAREIWLEQMLAREKRKTG